MLPIEIACEHTESVLSTILVAYDDSAPARRALEEAVHLARLEGARLVLVAVQDHLRWLDGGSAGEFLDQREQAQDSCRLRLWGASAYAAAQGVPARTEIRIGPVGRQLAAAADAYQADLVVVGRASSPRRRIRLKCSGAELLCRSLDRPLLIVSAPAHGPVP